MISFITNNFNKGCVTLETSEDRKKNLSTKNPLKIERTCLNAYNSNFKMLNMNITLTNILKLFLVLASCFLSSPRKGLRWS